MPRKTTKKPSVKVNDLRSKKNPKGGMQYIKFDPAVKLDTASNLKVTSALDKTSPTLTTSASYSKIKV